MSVTWGVMKFKADAQKCYDEIQTLGESYTPQDIVELAKDKKTELHKCFDWNNKEAAEKWRVHQARMICCSLMVVVQPQEEKPPISLRVIQHDRDDMAYKPVVLTVRNEDEYQRLLSQALAELKSFQVRYEKIVELQEVIEQIEICLKTV
jgi:hypothetical protein